MRLALCPLFLLPLASCTIFFRFILFTIPVVTLLCHPPPSTSQRRHRFLNLGRDGHRLGVAPKTRWCGTGEALALRDGGSLLLIRRQCLSPTQNAPAPCSPASFQLSGLQQCLRCALGPAAVDPQPSMDLATCRFGEPVLHYALGSPHPHIGMAACSSCKQLWALTLPLLQWRSVV